MSSKAIFLDRDGVINQERKDYVKNIDEFLIFEGVGLAIRRIKNKNFLVIVATNQSAINRNLLSKKTLDEIHQHLNTYLKEYDTVIDAIYYCPHLPEENCVCRKPKPGMLLKASKDYDIDLKNSWLIGNKITDIQAAQAVNCNSILIEKNQSLLDVINELIETKVK